MRTRVLICFLISMVSLISCSSKPSVTNKTASSKKLPVISIIADSKQALALFQQQEKTIEKKVGVRLEFHYPSRLNDNLEDFLFASKKRYDIYVLFPAKIPQYVERNMLLPIDNYIDKTKEMDDILPVYRDLYMKYQGHDYGMVYDGDTHLLFYRTDLFKKYNDEYKKTFGKDLTPHKLGRNTIKLQSSLQEIQIMMEKLTFMERPFLVVKPKDMFGLLKDICPWEITILMKT